MAENVFFTSDEHYGHNNVIRFCNRPFANLEEMTEGIIQKNNEVVRKGDLVYHMGDMFWRTFGQKEANEVIHRLNGNHYYIWGNHEELLKGSKYLQDLFVWCKDAALIHPAGAPHIHLSHYAHRVWNGSHRGNWHLYGHSHNELPPNPAGATKDESPLAFDVGVDTHNFYPWSLEEVTAVMKQREVKKPAYKLRCDGCLNFIFDNKPDSKTCAKCDTGILRLVL